LLSEEDWNHNRQYHKYLIGQIPENCQLALEIGCGTGNFSRFLAGRAEKVLAIDLSPQMIRVAREQSKLYTNIEFVAENALTFQFGENQFDSIATLTTMHHLPIEKFLDKVKKSLKPNGVFVCLDLYQRSNLNDLFFDCIAYPANLLFTLIKTGRLKPPREIRQAYAEHGKTDTYLTLPQIKRICRKILPGAIVKRHLFWRYSIVWKKEIIQ
jgi:ubiquinone/menaquinone biosynthesis C-methylase UbiE